MIQEHTLHRRRPTLANLFGSNIARSHEGPSFKKNRSTMSASNPPVPSSSDARDTCSAPSSSSESAVAPAGAPVRTGRLAGSGLRVAQGPKTPSGPRRPRRKNVVPDSILYDEALNADIALLPSNYSFEIHKTVWRVKSAGAKRVALQMPEGLLRFSCIIADILRKHAGGAAAVVMGRCDVWRVLC